MVSKSELYRMISNQAYEIERLEKMLKYILKQFTNEYNENYGLLGYDLRPTIAGKVDAIIKYLDINVDVAVSSTAVVAKKNNISDKKENK